MAFHHVWQRLRRKSSSADQKLAAWRRQIEASAPAGPPAVSLARLRNFCLDDVTIDPLETESRIHPRGFEVRAWVLVREADVSADQFKTIESSLAKLVPLTPAVRQIFFLATSYRLRIDDIAVFLGLTPRKVRKSILAAIAALDSSE